MIKTQQVGIVVFCGVLTADFSAGPTKQQLLLIQLLFILLFE